MAPPLSTSVAASRIFVAGGVAPNRRVFAVGAGGPPCRQRAPRGGVGPPARGGRDLRGGYSFCSCPAPPARGGAPNWRAIN
eukprot:5173514-Pyramimonas_sp.AAC.1